MSVDNWTIDQIRLLKEADECAELFIEKLGNYRGDYEAATTLAHAYVLLRERAGREEVPSE